LPPLFNVKEIEVVYDLSNGTASKLDGLSYNLINLKKYI